MNRMRRLLPGLKVVVIVAIFTLALRALQSTLASYSWGDFMLYVKSLPPGQLVLAILLAAAGYLVMTGYDMFAFRYLDRTLPYRRVALASFTAYAINNNLGLSGVVGTSLRYRFYSGWGVRAAEIAKIFVFCTVTYWLGFNLLGGLLFLFDPPAVPAKFDFPFASIRLLGLVMLLQVVAFAWFVARGRPLQLRRWELPAPKPRIFAAQVLTSVADWILAGAVLAALLPRSLPLLFLGILSVFLLAQIAGLVSNVPGGRDRGLGVERCRESDACNEDDEQRTVHDCHLAALNPLWSANPSAKRSSCLEGRESIQRRVQFVRLRVARWTAVEVGYRIEHRR